MERYYLLYIIYMHVLTCLRIRSLYRFNFSLQEFSQDMLLFDESVAVFDQRLGSILCRAFEDCSGCEAAFKVYALLMIDIIPASGSNTVVIQISTDL